MTQSIPRRSFFQTYVYDSNNLLGSGGFAKVYSGYRINDPTVKLAIKQIKMQRRYKERIRAEYNIHMSLDDPNIVKLIDCVEDSEGECKGDVFMVMEYCEGGDLEKYLGRYGPLNVVQAAQVVSQLVNGLKYLHGNNVMHRDVKPANVLLLSVKDPFSVVKLADFGLATRLRSKGAVAQSHCGTANFMSPEVSGRGSYTLESDLWSLGMTLYSILTGKRPDFYQMPDYVRDEAKRNDDAILSLKGKIKEMLLDIPKGSGLELTERLLELEPSDRIRLVDISQHRFITNNASAPRRGISPHRYDSGLGAGLSDARSASNSVKRSTSHQRYERMHPRRYRSPNVGNPVVVISDQHRPRSISRESAQRHDPGGPQRSNRDVQCRHSRYDDHYACMYCHQACNHSQLDDIDNNCRRCGWLSSTERAHRYLTRCPSYRDYGKCAGSCRVLQPPDDSPVLNLNDYIGIPRAQPVPPVRRSRSLQRSSPLVVAELQQGVATTSAMQSYHPTTVRSGRIPSTSGQNGRAKVEKIIVRTKNGDMATLYACGSFAMKLCNNGEEKFVARYKSGRIKPDTISDKERSDINTLYNVCIKLEATYTEIERSANVQCFPVQISLSHGVSRTSDMKGNSAFPLRDSTNTRPVAVVPTTNQQLVLRTVNDENVVNSDPSVLQFFDKQKQCWKTQLWYGKSKYDEFFSKEHSSTLNFFHVNGAPRIQFKRANIQTQSDYIQTRLSLIKRIDLSAYNRLMCLT